MPAAYSPQSRAERLIALGRVVLAAGSLFAVWLEPTQPAKYANIAYSLLAAYVVYSAALAAWVLRAESPPRARRVVTQIVDLAFFATFIYFTAGPSSPFIAYFVFSLVCGTLRWGWKGAMWTAVAALGSFLGLGAYFVHVLRDPAFELNPFIIYAVYLGVVAVLLGYLGAHEERSKREISQLANWPRGEPRDLESLARGLLTHARQVMTGSRAMLAWSDREEPWLYLATLHHAEFELRKLAPDKFQPLVSRELGNDPFLCASLRAKPPTVIRGTDDATSRWHGDPMHPELVEQLGLRGVIAAPLTGETITGWLFCVDKPAPTLDDLGLARIIAGIVAARVDLHYLLLRLRESAATEERIRLARDLHDGLMQSLTGIALRLAALQRQVVEEPDQAPSSIEDISRLLALEQQELRFFIDELRPTPPRGGAQRTLGARLEELRERVELEWNLEVELPQARSWEAIPDGLAREIYPIIREALVNAVRHGSASRVTVRSWEVRDGRLVTEIVDNGCGFPFHGTFSQDELLAEKLGPRSICERVTGLRGMLRLESAPGGSRLTVELPLDPSRA